MGVEEWLCRGRRDMRPLLLKVGVVFSLSVSGYLYSHLVSRSHTRRRLRQRPHTTPAGAEGGCGGLKDEILRLQCEDAGSNAINGSTGVAVDLSLHSKSTMEEEEERLLSEFNALLLREWGSVGIDMVTLGPSSLKKRSSPLDCKNGAASIVVAEQDVVFLKGLVQSLQERERSLEMQLLEYYGLKEQESATMELESHLKMSAMEADFLHLKIESLQADNRRLGAQVEDLREAKGELEAARVRLRHLKRKLKSESLKAKDTIAVLQLRIAALQDVEQRWEEEAAEEAERRQTRVRDLEGEVAELRKAIRKMAAENSDMAKKLESTRRLTSPEESNSLRQQNDELVKQLEQIQTDHCADVEELVYLRWVNACLRYELRNYQPPPGKTMARDLSRTLSPDSEHKVKRLILEYSNSGVDEKNTNMTDFELETCSSQASSGDPEETAIDVPTPTPTRPHGGSSSKKRFLAKLRSLVLRKENKDHSKFDSPVGGSPTTSYGNPGRRTSTSARSFDETAPVDHRTSCDSTAASCSAALDHEMAIQEQEEGSPWTRDLSSISLNFRRLRIHGDHSKVDVGTGGATPREKSPPHRASSPRRAL